VNLLGFEMDYGIWETNTNIEGYNVSYAANAAMMGDAFHVTNLCAAGSGFTSPPCNPTSGHLNFSFVSGNGAADTALSVGTTGLNAAPDAHSQSIVYNMWDHSGSAAFLLTYAFTNASTSPAFSILGGDTTTMVPNYNGFYFMTALPGAGPIVYAAQGPDTNISVDLFAKGTGIITIGTQSPGNTQAVFIPQLTAAGAGNFVCVNSANGGLYRNTTCP
jgi:hypothetical protein